MTHEQYVPLTDMISELDVPFCTPVGPDGLVFWWPLTKVEIHARRFGHQGGQAELAIWFHDASTGDRQLGLAPTNVQLTSIQQKSSLLNFLTRWNGDLPWLWYIEAVAHEVRKVTTAQNPMAQVLSDPSMSIEPDYLLHPLLYRGHPTIVFGAKGSAKSLLAAAVSYIVQLPLLNNEMGLRPGTRQTTVGYLDWEDVRCTFQARWTGICQGFQKQHPDFIAPDLQLPVWHKQMQGPLCNQIDLVREELVANDVGMVVIDSLGPAAGGDLYAPAAALDFYGALRSLQVTALILAHHSKDPNTKAKSVYGSTFFNALARSVWQTEAEDTREDDNELVTSITEIHCNLAAKHGTRGFRYKFDNEAHTITVTRADLEGTTLEKKLSNSTRITQALTRIGPMTSKEISAETGIKENVVRTTTGRMLHQNQIAKVGDKWAALAQPQQ